jgi:hypothetical protein
MTPLYIQSVITKLMQEIDVSELPPAAAGLLSGIDPVSALTDSAASMLGAVQSNVGLGVDMAAMLPLLKEMFQ